MKALSLLLLFFSFAAAAETRYGMYANDRLSLHLSGNNWTAAGALSWNSGTATLSCLTASGSVTGCLASADWTTFNNKQPALPWTTAGDTVYYGGTQTGSRLAIGTAYQLMGTNTGATAPAWMTLAGTANRVTVSGSGTTITLSGPQDLAAASSPTFAALTLSSPLTMPNGGTGLSSGTSGGILYFSASNALSSSGALTQYQVVLGGGAGGAPNVVSGTGTSGQVLTSNGAGANPTWQSGPAGGATSVAFSNTGNANGGSISGTVLTLSAATSTQPGGIQASGAQTLGATLTLANSLTITSTKALLWSADTGAGSDIGDSASTGRPRDIWIGRDVNADRNVIAGATSSFGFSGATTTGLTNNAGFFIQWAGVAVAQIASAVIQTQGNTFEWSHYAGGTNTSKWGTYSGAIYTYNMGFMGPGGFLIGLATGTTTPNYHLDLRQKTAATAIYSQYSITTTTGTTSTDGTLFGLNATGESIWNNQEATTTRIQNNGTDYWTMDTTSGVQEKGTTTNNSAAAGYRGEISGSCSQASATNFPTSTQYGDLCSVSLTAGDWDCTLTASVTLNSAVMTSFDIGISQTTGNSTTGLSLYDGSQAESAALPVGSIAQTISLPRFRQSLSGTTTVYAKVSATYTGGPPQYGGKLYCRRER